MKYKILTPAYGRDYKSGVAAREDFEANKDFLAQPEGQVTNKTDLKNMGYDVVNIRYKEMRNVVVVKIK